jgi:hypothetical protein
MLGLSGGDQGWDMCGSGPDGPKRQEKCENLLGVVLLKKENACLFCSLLNFQGACSLPQPRKYSSLSSTLTCL